MGVSGSIFAIRRACYQGGRPLYQEDASKNAPEVEQTPLSLGRNSASRKGLVDQRMYPDLFSPLGLPPRTAWGDTQALGIFNSGAALLDSGVNAGDIRLSHQGFPATRIAIIRYRRGRGYISLVAIARAGTTPDANIPPKVSIGFEFFRIPTARPAARVRRISRVISPPVDRFPEHRRFRTWGWRCRSSIFIR